MKKCPLITEEQRIRACLALNGVTTVARGPRAMPSQQQQQQAQQQQVHPEIDLSLLQPQQGWTPLETLAEVSRQINHLNEHGEDGDQAQHAAGSSAEPMTGVVTSAPSHASHEIDLLNLQDQDQAQEKQGQSVVPSGYDGLSTTGDFTMQDLMPLTAALSSQDQRGQDARSISPSVPNLAVAAAAAAAAAATARLSSTSVAEPPLVAQPGANIGGNLGEELARAIGSVEPGQQQDGTNSAVPPSQPPASGTEAPTAQESAPTRHSLPSSQITPSASFSKVFSSSKAPTPPPNRSPASSTSTSATLSHGAQLPWGEFTYKANRPMPSGSASGLPTKSVFRLEQNGNRSRHARARFEETRRKEVQQIRMIGACVRCRILRKTCSKGDPCDTCRKVLAPRLWRSGCIRIKFTDELDLYNAGVQIAHCKKMVNDYKEALDFEQHKPILLDATQSTSGIGITVDALRGSKRSEPVDPTRREEYHAAVQVTMIDDMDALPDKLQDYVRDMLPEFIGKEEAEFSKITLATACDLPCQTEDEKMVLQMAIEHWGYVEIVERELKWTLALRPSPVVRTAGRPITRETDDELYKTICLQLTAAAERRAMITSKDLLKKLQQMLQHGRTTIRHPVFFAIIILLISLEKSTWAFKSWEEIEELRELWPLDKAPEYYTCQGLRMAEIFRMLLVIRKALPKIAIREDGVLVLEDTDSVYASYLERINLKGKRTAPFSPHQADGANPHLPASHVIKQMKNPEIDYATSRTLELHLCAHILLPDEELQAHAPAPPPPPPAAPAPALAPATTSATFELQPQQEDAESAPQTPGVASQPQPSAGTHLTT